MRIGVLTLDDAQGFQNFVARHVGQIQIEQDDVVVIELAKIDAFFTQIGRVDVEPLGLEHQFNALGRRGIVLDQQYPHLESPIVLGLVLSPSVAPGEPARAQLAVNTRC